MKLKLFTIQRPDVLYKIMQNGYYRTDMSKTDSFFSEHYGFMIEQMIDRCIEFPKGFSDPFKNPPVWAWYIYDGENKVPDNLETCGVGVEGEEYVCIEFEIEEDDVLLSDFDAWHNVLNNSWYEGSLSEPEYNTLHEWYDRLPGKEKEILKTISWERIFDIEKFKNEWTSRGFYVQGTIWELRKEMITNVRKFVAKEMEE